MCLASTHLLAVAQLRDGCLQRLEVHLWSCRPAAGLLGQVAAHLAVAAEHHQLLRAITAVVTHQHAGHWGTHGVTAHQVAVR